MGFDGLARFLMSSDNLILKKSYLSEEHDLGHPLSHYFIHSSHNTYLIGRYLFNLSKYCSNDLTRKPLYTRGLVFWILVATRLTIYKQRKVPQVTRC